MEKATLSFRMYKICQILKRFAGTFRRAQTSFFWIVSILASFSVEPIRLKIICYDLLTAIVQQGNKCTHCLQFSSKYALIFTPKRDTKNLIWKKITLASLVSTASIILYYYIIIIRFFDFSTEEFFGRRPPNSKRSCNIEI